jgi:hypothetical protein
MLIAGREIPVSLLRTVVPLVLLQAALIFQVFPRGSFNVWLVQGALLPLLTIVVYAWYRLGAPPTASRVRKASAALLVSTLPIWMITPAVRHLDEKLSATPAEDLGIPRARGIKLTVGEAGLIDPSEVKQMVALLRRAAPPDAPLLPITTDMSLLYLSGRRHVFPDVDYYFFLLALDMLPVAQRRELAAAPLGCRLADAPDTLIVLRPDDVAGRILRTVPSLRDVVTQNYETIAALGRNLVLRRKPNAQYPSSCATRSR